MTIDKLKDQLTRHEGLRLRPYRCTAGKLTIGYGRNLDDVGISKEEAEYLLENDIKKVLEEVRAKFKWFDDLTDNRQMVIANMAFNMGMTGLLTFKRTLDHIQSGRYRDAADQMLQSAWARQVGHRADELAELMREG